MTWGLPYSAARWSVELHKDFPSSFFLSLDPWSCDFSRSFYLFLFYPFFEWYWSPKVWRWPLNWIFALPLSQSVSLLLLFCLCLLIPYSDVCKANLIKIIFLLNNFSKSWAPLGGLCTIFLAFLDFIFHFFYLHYENSAELRFKKKIMLFEAFLFYCKLTVFPNECILVQDRVINSRSCLITFYLCHLGLVGKLFTFCC